MAVGEFAVIDHHPSGGVGGDIVVAAIHFGWLVDIGEETVSGLLDGIGAAERTDHTLFFQRVLLLGGGLAADGTLARGGGQQGAVPPVGVCRQICVRVQPLAVHPAKDVLAVGGGGGPVHELVGTVAAFVKLVDAPLLREIPGDGGVFLRGHIAGQRDHDAHPGSLRRVAVGGVEAGGIAASIGEPLDEIGVGVIHILSQHGAADHVFPLAAVVPELASHKAALVLGPVTVSLRQLGILLHRFRGADGGGEAVAQSIKADSLVRPGLGITAIAIGDRQITHGQKPPCSCW